MSRFDFKGTGEFARVNNTEAAMQLFEDYDIPYHYITKGENEGKIRVKSMKNFAHDEYEQLRSTLMSHGYGWLIDHAAMFHDVDDGVVICFSPYHFPYSIDDNGKITYREIVLYGYECEVRHPGIYGYGTATAVLRKA